MNSPEIIFRLVRIFLAYKQKRDVLPYKPIRLWIESSSVCNLRCPMCHNREFSSDAKSHMDMNLYKKIIDEAGTFANDVYLHHRGEPLTNPNFFEMIKYAREHGLKTRFHTNATLLDQKKAECLLESAPDFISISVDGFNKSEYERIRVGANFETTVRNIQELARLRNARGQRKPYIVVERIRFRSSHDSEDAIAIAKLKSEFLSVGIDEVIEKEEYIWASESAPEPESLRKRAVCTFPWYAMVICADGTVTPCPQDYWAKMNMGNVKTTSLADIWNGNEYRQLRIAFRTDINKLPLCRKCDRLHRKTIGGIPLQYMYAFLTDQLIGYTRIRKFIGSHERN